MVGNVGAFQQIREMRQSGAIQAASAPLAFEEQGREARMETQALAN